jgi:predicted nucleic acid-binding protein
VGVALLDRSAVVAYLYADDSPHAEAVDAIEAAMRGGASLAISAVTWAEVLNGASVGHQEQEVVRGSVGEFGIAILAVDAVVAEQAVALQGAYARTGRGRDRPRMRTPDALILATAATRDDIDAVICGDAKWPKVPGVSRPIRLLRERRTR